VHEIIPKSRKTDWDSFGNQVVLCAECHEWAHQIGTKESSKVLMELRHRRLMEYLNYQDVYDLINNKELELSKSYGKLVTMTDAEFYLISETVYNLKQQIDDLKFLLELEQDAD